MSAASGFCRSLTRSACLQLQTLMLQMAADAAAPAARPSRTAETSTSTLWAPDAPLLRGLGTNDNQHQRGHVCGAAVPQQHAQQEPQQSQEQATQAAELPVHVAQSAAALDNVSVSNSAESSQPAQMPGAAQQEAQQMHHHDAHQPWGRVWAQPMLPAVTIAAGYTGQGRSNPGRQHRRGTAESMAVSASLQQHRHSRGLHAARSLSWSRSAEEHPTGSLPSSGKWLIGAC